MALPPCRLISFLIFRSENMSMSMGKYSRPCLVFRPIKVVIRYTLLKYCLTSSMNCWRERQTMYLYSPSAVTSCCHHCWRWLWRESGAVVFISMRSAPCCLLDLRMMRSETPATTPSALRRAASVLERPPPLGTAKSRPRRRGYWMENHWTQADCRWCSGERRGRRTRRMLLLLLP